MEKRRKRSAEPRGRYAFSEWTKAAMEEAKSEMGGKPGKSESVKYFIIIMVL